MITNFKDFSLNESGTYGKGDFKKVYSISNFLPKEDLDMNSYEDISIELIRMERLFMGQGGNLVGANLNHITKTLNGYVKTKMYNKLVEMMYSKGYSNPTGDTTPIKSDYDNEFERAYVEELIKSGRSNRGDAIEQGVDVTTRGEYFKKTWAQLDKYCDNSVEFLVKHEIEDTTGDIITVSKWVGYGIAVAIANALTGGGSSFLMASGSAETATATAGGLLARREFQMLIPKFAKLLGKLPKWVYGFIKKILLWILTNPIAQVIAFANIDILTRLSLKINEFLIEEGARDIALSEDDLATIQKFGTRLSGKGASFSSIDFYNEVKETFMLEVERINKALQQHSDFYLKADWSGIQNMPGWKTWKEKTNYKGKSSDLGYMYTWWIAYYCTEFQYFIYNYFHLMECKNRAKNKN
jgi:hypothetical protein